ncbi:MAG: hypothetical protein D3916_04705 [Candidatus Electrothrix sp. MAN1_4]|nr:hypothetical protein [Candidatus Electrothrix sp. MAN1_4]
MSIEISIRTLFAQKLHEAVAGLEYTYLVDLNSGDVAVAYPVEESKAGTYIAEICGTTTSQFEQRARSLNKNNDSLLLTSMEILTTHDKNNMRIATYRINDSFALCLIGKEETFRPAFAKRLCDGPIKDEIEEILEQFNISG